MSYITRQDEERRVTDIHVAKERRTYHRRMTDLTQERIIAQRDMKHCFIGLGLSLLTLFAWVLLH